MGIDREYRYNLDIEILHYGKVSLTPEWHFKNAKSYYTRLYFVKSGNGFLRAGEKTIPLSGGNIYIVPSDYTFDYGCETLEKIYFHILLPMGERTDILADAERIVVLPDSEKTIYALYDAYEKKDLGSRMQVKLLVYETVQKMICDCKLQLKGGKTLSPLVSNALRYIWSRVSVKLSAKQIAQALYVSESTLRNFFKEETGIAIGTYIDDAVFFTVRKMLDSGFSIEEIAEKMKFCDRHYLSRRFKEKFGKTISQYKKEQPS